MGRRNSMPVDERIKGRSLLGIKTKARTIWGRGNKSLCSDRGSELRLGREREKKSAKIIRSWDEQIK